MNLKDLNDLGIKVQEKINTYDYKEMLLSEEFKKEFKLFLETNSNDKIEYEKYTSLVTTTKGLKIICDNRRPSSDVMSDVLRPSSSNENVSSVGDV